MMKNDIVKKIEEFVYQKPRSVQEIAEHIKKNWRTADRYIDEIAHEYGTLDTRVFRGGTKGALKIVYWASIEKVSANKFQEELERKIFNGTKKEDFKAFDIYQYVEPNKRKVLVKISKSEEEEGLKEFEGFLNEAKRQLLIFSGNLSFINFKDKNTDIFSVIEKIVKNGISIKILCRVDLGGKNNIEKLLSLNFKYGKELIEIRHCEHPLRAIIVDHNFFNIKEIQTPTGRTKELSKNAFLFYDVKEKSWVEWLTRIFWKMFSSSIDSRKRLKELDYLKV